MKTLKITQLSIAHGKCKLFQDAQLTINFGQKYGLIGPNGCGKSTLLNHIRSSFPDADLFLCEQEILADNKSAFNFVIEADAKRLALLAREEELIEKEDLSAEEQKELEEIADDLIFFRGDSAESRVRQILAGLGFSAQEMAQPICEFSGGWRMRLSLARALFLQPAYLLLDEPTNHLDINAVIWLKKYLLAWKKTLLFVTHDLSFLDEICNEIIHVENKQLFNYKGNYSTFLKMLAQKKQTEKKAHDKLVSECRRLKKKAPQPLPHDYSVSFFFEEPRIFSGPALAFDHVTFNFPGKSNVFDNANFEIARDSKIALVGSNGAGKSTLLKLIAQVVKPTSGDIHINGQLKIGYLNQHSCDQFDLDETPISYLHKKFNLCLQDCHKSVGSVGLASFAHNISMRYLSGGQKARVAFADLICQHPNILLLDEPTNNLDVETIEALICAISNFQGAIIMTTHDERLIRETNCDLFVVAHAKIEEFNGTFDDYEQTIC